MSKTVVLSHTYLDSNFCYVGAYESVDQHIMSFISLSSHDMK